MGFDTLPCFFLTKNGSGQWADGRIMAGYQVLDVSEIENLLLHFTEANKKYATLRHGRLMLFTLW